MSLAQGKRSFKTILLLSLARATIPQPFALCEGLVPDDVKALCSRLSHARNARLSFLRCGEMSTGHVRGGVGVWARILADEMGFGEGVEQTG